MERYTMFLDWKNQHCENDHTTQSNRQVQCTPIKLPMAFFTQLEQQQQQISQFVWKHKRPWVAKKLLRKKNGAGGISFPTSDYTTKLQSSRQGGTGTKTEIYISGARYKAQRWTHIPMGTLSLTKESRIYNGEETVSSISGGGKTGQPHVKEWN